MDVFHIVQKLQMQFHASRKEGPPCGEQRYYRSEFHVGLNLMQYYAEYRVIWECSGKERQISPSPHSNTQKWSPTCQKQFQNSSFNHQKIDCVFPIFS